MNDNRIVEGLFLLHILLNDIDSVEGTLSENLLHKVCGNMKILCDHSVTTTTYVL